MIPTQNLIYKIITSINYLNTIKKQAKRHKIHNSCKVKKASVNPVYDNGDWQLYNVTLCDKKCNFFTFSSYILAGLIQFHLKFHDNSDI